MAGPPGAAPAAPQWYPPSPPPPPSKENNLRRFVKDPLSIVLILVIVVAVVFAGLLVAELIARSRANSVVAKVVSCVVHDQAKVSFGVMPPFLLQHLNRHYTNISVQTAGNQLLDAKGMKLDLDIKDVKLNDGKDAGGTIGALNATIRWSTDGIKNTVQDAIPLFGGIVSSVKTNPGAGTIEMDGALGSVTAKPQVVDNGLALQVVSVTGLGFTLPSETVQPALDAFTAQLTKNYPLGIHADSVQVTDSGVTSQFSTQNATMPAGQQDSCYTGL